MKFNRFLALAMIAVLIVGTMAVIAARADAQKTPASPVDSAAAAQSEGSEAEQAGELEDGQAGEADDAEEMDGEEADDANEADGEDADEQDEAVVGTPAITAAAAQKAAEAHLQAGVANEVELEMENGELVYSVEFGGDTEVLVDAMTGAVLGVETGDD